MGLPSFEVRPVDPFDKLKSFEVFQNGPETRLLGVSETQALSRPAADPAGS